MVRSSWHRRLRVGAWTLLLLLAVALPTRGAQADAAHLRFFKQNRDFLLRAFERAHSQQPTNGTLQAWNFDPFAEWSVHERVQAARAALDTATAPEHLGTFHAALGDLLVAADSAASRLDDLDRRFAAHLRTAVEVTLDADEHVDLQRIEAHLDGAPVVDMAVSEVERRALAAGGVLEVLRRVVEVRPQNLLLRWWVAGDTNPRELQQELSPVPDALVRVHVHVPASTAEAGVVQSTLGGE